jgi:hypothetical protein
MLRLVHPAREGQDPPKRRKGNRTPALSLTHEECQHVRAALRNAARACGGNKALALALGIPAGSMHNFRLRKYRLSGTFAIRLAKVMGVSVESILSGAMADASRCETCGHRPGTGRLVAASKSEEPRPWPTGGGVA